MMELKAMLVKVEMIVVRSNIMYSHKGLIEVSGVEERCTRIVAFFSFNLSLTWRLVVHESVHEVDGPIC